MKKIFVLLVLMLLQSCAHREVRADLEQKLRNVMALKRQYDATEFPAGWSKERRVNAFLDSKRVPPERRHFLGQYLADR